MSPEIALDDIPWIPRQRLAPLKKLGITDLGGLILHFPRRYEDRSAFGPFPDSELSTSVCLLGRVAIVGLKRLGGHRTVCEVRIESPQSGVFNHPVICRWFNIPYIRNQFLVGQLAVIYGRPKARGRQIVIDHPEYEILDEEESPTSSLHLGRIVPIYPAGEGVTPRVLRTLVDRALQECDLEELRILPPHARADSRAIFTGIHFPRSFEHCESARCELGLEESYAIQVAVQLRRSRWTGAGGKARPSAGHLVQQLIDSLPFRLTQSQQNVIREIRDDLTAPRRMNRLLQGDVGAGKTAVAMVAVAHVLETGSRAVVMAPTQLLAEQHLATFRRAFDPLGIEVGFRVGGRNTAETPLLPCQILIGTHALLYDDNPPPDIGLVVIDEQHKFGVLQRSKLIALPGTPDALVMTATPIPRTLAQTLYGDLDVSILDAKPVGRAEIRTVVRPTTKLPDVVDFLNKHLANGRQAYIVYPLVEESEKLVAKAASEEFERWRNFLAPHRVALLHGRTPPEEKEVVMRDFRSGAVSALVSTTVIEVGVDVPNATLMVVENAERFGLAQLHQLRGRIGRGSEKSFCILLHTGGSHDAQQRLAVMERTSDGFEIAEEDLRIRGPGNVLGTAQAGFPPLQLAEISLQPTTLDQAARLARETLSADPTLTAPAHARLRRLMQKFDQRTAA
ncbi:MAG: ATP-dependent DNA helicase RecG [Terrimicrobiaceae bacterium]